LLTTSFPEFCTYAEHVATLSPLFIGLTTSGKLHIVDHRSNNYLLALNANSFTIASGFVVYTTTAHMSHYAPLASLVTLLKKLEEGEQVKDEDVKWETRRVERGSRIVTAVPSTMSLVLQMPRGNLETINPRPLVMEIVKQDIDGSVYARIGSITCMLTVVSQS
jgi:elongator complex protein 1